MMIKGYSERKPVVITYDIRSNRIRARVRNILRDWRLGGQKSVCECLLSKTEAEELFLQISLLIDGDTDNLLMVWLSQKRRFLGLGLGRKRNMMTKFKPII